MDRISLIYRLLLLHLIVGEANQTVDRLGLSHARVYGLNEIRDFPVLPPKDWAGRMEGFSCAIITSNLNFGVSAGGALPSVGLIQLHDEPNGARGVEDWRDGEGKIGVPRGSVKKEMAYQLARDWLEKMGVDVRVMENKYPPRTEHHELPLTSRNTVSSRFSVKWGGSNHAGQGQRPAAEVFLNVSQKWPVRIHVTDLSLYRNPLPELPHAIAISQLPDHPVQEFFRLRPGEPLERIFTDHPFDYTNVFALLKVSKAYEAECRRLLLVEAKQILSLLGCDQLDEPTKENLTDLYVNPPAFGSGGRLEFKNGEMQFNTQGKLRLFQFLPRGQTNSNIWLSTRQSIISTDQALQIATQKLAALSIDVGQMDRNYKRAFSQRQSYKYDDKGKRVWFYTPEYWLTWADAADASKPAVATVTVYGDVKQVGRIELNDTKYWKRPPVVVTNIQRR